MSIIRENIQRDLKMALNKNGAMPEGMQQLIANYVENPSSALWDQIRQAVLAVDRDDKDMTLWRAVSIIDPTFPKVRPTLQNKYIGERRVVDQYGNQVQWRIWNRIPTPEQVERAVEWSTH